MKYIVRNPDTMLYLAKSPGAFGNWCQSRRLADMFETEESAREAYRAAMKPNEPLVIEVKDGEAP